MRSVKDLLNTPLKDLSPEERKAAFSADNAHRAKIERENKEYIMKPVGLHVITDSIEVVNPADGKYYSSKSRYYQTLKDTGNHIIEKGEQGHKRELRGDYDNKQELRQALQQHLGRR